jgi:hypothetical protein
LSSLESSVFSPCERHAIRIRVGQRNDVVIEEQAWLG